MSCGNHHETDCSDVLDRLYSYLDAEIRSDDPVDVGKIQHHLDECAPCLREYDIEVILKQLVRRACASDCAPTELRVRIMARISAARA